jgi:hypothetical protein
MERRRVWAETLGDGGALAEWHWGEPPCDASTVDRLEGGSVAMGGAPIAVEIAAFREVGRGLFRVEITGRGASGRVALAAAMRVLLARMPMEWADEGLAVVVSGDSRCALDLLDARMTFEPREEGPEATARGEERRT